jgi:hypothetical protein
MSELIPGKQTVVQRRGATWAFHLPDRHEVQVNRDNNTVTLSQPDSGSTYELAGVEERDDEIIVKLGAEIAGHAAGVGDQARQPGYRMPEIQDEFERLRGRWERAGLNPQKFNAWAQGASWESHLTEIRRELRQAGG